MSGSIGPQCLNDFERIAKISIDRHVYQLIRCGSDDEQTLKRNEKAYTKYVG